MIPNNENLGRIVISAHALLHYKAPGGQDKFWSNLSIFPKTKHLSWNKYSISMLN